jgi:hypothetical protein
MDVVRRLLAAGLIAILSLFAVACNGDDGDGGDDVEQDVGGDEGEGDDD